MAQLKVQTEKIAFEQKRLSPSAKDIIEILSHSQIEMLKTIESLVRELEHMKMTILLPPLDLVRLNNLLVEFSVLQRQLELYHNELRHLMTGEPGRCFASLLIVKQPFPKTIKQHIKTSTAVDDPVVVRLLIGARVEVRPITPCRAELIYEDYQAKRSEVVVQNDTQELGPNLTATFADLRFPHGTRLKTVVLQFSVQIHWITVDGNSGMMSLESQTSNPFVVMTNENQWDVSEGILLQKDAFGGAMEMTWAYFANTLQIHYLKATRQDVQRAQRPLSAADLAYFHEVKLDRKRVINQKDFERFWEWFGKVLHKIRHQRHLSMLWLKGLIYGFIAKEEAEELLKYEEPGTFLIRFSDRIAGQFAVAYVKWSKSSMQKEVKHYLVKPDDITGPSKTLADFLKVHENFIYLVEKRLDFVHEGSAIRGRCPKNQVLEEFYSKKSITTIDGYDEEIDD